MTMPAPHAHGTSVVLPGEGLREVASGFKFTEGPTADAEGNVYFTDQPNNRIHQWSAADGSVTTFMEPAGRSNGLCFDSGRGRLLACADAKNELWSVDPVTTAVTVLVTGYGGKLLNGPNDVWVHPAGGVYFTGPYYERDYWHRGPGEQGGEHVYLLPGGRPLVRVTDDLEKPNGLVGAPDGRTLYVVDIGAGKTYGYTVRGDGTLEGKRLFCHAGSDGMTIDSDGNLYLTGGDGVTVFGAQGQEVERIAVPGGGRTSNVCFGGPTRRTLFVTAGGGLFSVRTRVTGVFEQIVQR